MNSIHLWFQEAGSDGYGALLSLMQSNNIFSTFCRSIQSPLPFHKAQAGSRVVGLVKLFLLPILDKELIPALNTRGSIKQRFLYKKLSFYFEPREREKK